MQARKGRLCLGLVEKATTASGLKEVKKWAEGLCPYDGGWNVIFEKSLPGIQYDGTECPSKAPLFATVKEDCVLYHDLVMSAVGKATTLVTDIDGVTISGADLFEVLSITQATELLHKNILELLVSGELAIKDGNLVKPLDGQNGLMPELPEASSSES